MRDERCRSQYLTLTIASARIPGAYRVKSADYVRVSLWSSPGPRAGRLHTAKSGARFAHLVGLLLADNTYYPSFKFFARTASSRTLGELHRFGKPLVPVTRYGPYIINYVVALFVMRYILGKTFRHFRLGLISNDGVSPAQTLDPTVIRTMRVWWIFT
jgi:hypothetical protein